MNPNKVVIVLSVFFFALFYRPVRAEVEHLPAERDARLARLEELRTEKSEQWQRRGYLGVTFILIELGAPRPGFYLEVLKTRPGTPAAASGLRPGDLIAAYDDEPFSGDFMALWQRLERIEVGQIVRVDFYRDGQEAWETEIEAKPPSARVFDSWLRFHLQQVEARSDATTSPNIEIVDTAERKEWSDFNLQPSTFNIRRISRESHHVRRVGRSQSSEIGASLWCWHPGAHRLRLEQDAKSEPAQ